MSEIKLDNQHFSILEYVYDNPYISYPSLIAAFPSYGEIEDIVRMLDLHKMISIRVAASPETDKEKYECCNPDENSHLVAISTGKAIIEQERKRTNELNAKIQPLYAIAEKTSSIAESASVQATIAKEQSDKAKETSFAAKFRANLSIVISLLALLATLLANADKIVHNVQRILSHLGML